MDLWAVGVAILMLLLFGGVAYLVRRLGLGGAAGLLTKNSADIQVVGARRLDLNATLYIVEGRGAPPARRVRPGRRAPRGPI
jgi:flagellar biogenesis protein FliO